MKKWYIALCGLTAILAILGGAFSFHPLAGRCLLGVALAGAILLMLLRPRAKGEAALAIGATERESACAPGCTFADVAANDEARASLLQLKDYILNPERYVRFGARMPRGVLLYGPPGTGKTLLAKALAGEANVPFFALSGSDFVEKYVGVGAMRVRELFKKARKAGKCVIFIDEIDAMGKKRSDASSDERDQTLNALLSEMSGFHSGDGIIVLAATNRIEMLDPALLRPGRFDRQIEVGLPGMKERLSILELHSRNKPMAEDVNLSALAAQTAYFSGASLENLLNEAAMLAASGDDPEIGMRHIRTALVNTIIGADRQSTASEMEKKIIAIHEAGHAVATKALSPGHRLTRISILPAGKGAAGYNLAIPPEKVMLRKEDLEKQICILLAGRAAEMIVFGDDALTAGASNDLERATELASAMVCELGMGGDPAVSLKVLGRVCGNNLGAADKSRELLGEMLNRARALISENIGKLDALASALLAQETLTDEEIDALMSNERQ